MTIVTAAFTYNALFLEPRHRNTTERRLIGLIPLEIEDMDGIDAPVALTYPALAGGTMLPVDLRFDGDAFWRPLRDDDGDLLAPGRLDDLLRNFDAQAKEVFHTWRDYPFPRRVAQAAAAWNGREDVLERFAGLKTREETQIAEWRSSDFDERAAEMAASLKDLRVIGNVIHKRAPEPTWLIHPAGSPRGRNPQLWTKEPIRRAGEIYLRIDRLKQAEDLAARLYPGIWVEEHQKSVVIHAPEAIRHDDAIEFARSLVDERLPRLANAVGGMNSVETMRAWCDLREMADDWDGENRDHAVAMVLKAAEFADLDVSVRERRLSWNGDPVADGYADLTVANPLDVFPVAVEHYGFDRPAGTDDEAAMTL